MNNEPTDEQLLLLIRRESSERAIDELMNRYKGMVRKHARAHYLIGGDNDDLIQEGMIALYKAVKSYDFEKSNDLGEGNARQGSFAAYASACISNHLYNVIKGANRLKNVPLNTSISLDAPVSPNSPDSDTRTVADTLPPDVSSDPELIIIDRENVVDIENSIVSRLSPLEQEVVRRYIDGSSISDIAKSMGRTPKSIDNALQRVKKKLSK